MIRDEFFLREVSEIDRWLDENVSDKFKTQPLAQDWARISKVIEELGEAISEFISFTGQNPRKEQDNQAFLKMLNEMADVVCTGILGIQHFTKNHRATQNIIEVRMTRIHDRVLNA